MSKQIAIKKKKIQLSFIAILKINIRQQVTNSGDISQAKLHTIRNA
jgi:adenylyl- and sulfurtransferase ThiI